MREYETDNDYEMARTAKSGGGDETQVNASRERFRRIYTLLRNRICLLDYPPGTRLSEEALAAEFGISRTPLRRVLGWLESQGLLRSVHGVGTIVTDVEIDAFVQVYQLRMELAELVGKLSPVPPTPETIGIFHELERRGSDLQQKPDPHAFAQLNIDFFHALMRLTENEPLREISERLYYQTARIWLKSISQMNLAQEVTIFAREIAEVRAAVEIGDVSAASHIRRSHISMSFVRLSNTKAETKITS
jgi:DNA-binding GntR family transcriptional regulator